MPEARLVLVTGAGASTALGSPEHLPMMGEWCSSITQALDQVEPGLAEAVGLVDGMEGDAFERSLGQFLQWQRDIGLMDRFAKLRSQPGQVRNTRGDFQNWLQFAKDRVPRIIQTINDSLWREFGLARIDIEATRSAYGRFLAAVGASRTDGTQLFSATTNYDRSGEAGWAENEYMPDDGGRFERFGGSRFLRVQEITPWADRGSVPHLHLHGAVGWYRRPGSGILIEPADRDFDARLVPAVLYPDPNKDPYNETDLGVQSIWQIFEEALSDATHILVLGHSLHDRPLVAALERRLLRPDVRVGVTYFGDESAAKLLIDQLSGTAFASDRVDLSLFPLAFGPDADLSPLSRWFAGDVLGLELQRPKPAQGRSASEIAPPARPIDISAFDVLTGQALPADDADIGPAIGLRHTSESDTLVVLRQAPPPSFLLEFDLQLLPGGLLNVMFSFDPDRWTGYMARLDTRPYPPEGDRFLSLQGGGPGAWQDEVMGQVKSPSDKWFPAALRVQDGNATLFREGSPVARFRVSGRGRVGFMTELQTAHIANVRITNLSRAGY